MSWASEIARPSRTSAAAALRLAGVIRFAAPSSSSWPQRPQLDSSVNARWKSCSVVNVLLPCTSTRTSNTAATSNTAIATAAPRTSDNRDIGSGTPVFVMIIPPLTCLLLAFLSGHLRTAVDGRVIAQSHRQPAGRRNSHCPLTFSEDVVDATANYCLELLANLAGRQRFSWPVSGNPDKYGSFSRNP